MKHKHILLLLLIKVSFPVGVCARATLVSKRLDGLGPWRRLSGEFGWGFVAGPLASSAAVWCKSFVFSLLPIRKGWVLILGFWSVYAQARRSYYLCF